MSDDFRDQIYNNLNLKDTNELVKIWEENDRSEWTDMTFDVLRGILQVRLGTLPSQSEPFYEPIEKNTKRNSSKRVEFAHLKSIPTQVRQVLSRGDRYLKAGELDKALGECNLAIQMSPELAIAYNYRGQIYDEMDQLENAIADYQSAIRLDPGLKVAWDNMIVVEKDIEEEFQESPSKQHLDQALEYAYDDEFDKALEECELARQGLPGIAIAHNYLGVILEGLNQLESAIDSYLEAIRLNPRFYAARENLSNARVNMEEELYRQVPMEKQDEAQEDRETITDFDEFEFSEMSDEGNPVPEWVYMDEKALLLVGWAGHRTRTGRSGYDPLESDFEFAHIQGVIFRSLMNRKFRTHNPFYLLLMTWVGLIYCLPLIFAGMSLPQSDLDLATILIVASPNWIVGMALLTNVILSLNPEETDETGKVFF